MVGTMKPIDDIITRWVERQSRVLDLGCGDGALLSRLEGEKGIEGIGVEISHDMVVRCLAQGLSVYQADIDKGLAQWEDMSFDTVILKSTLEVIHRPCELIGEMLRVGRKAIVSVSNFGYLPNRLKVLFTGSMSPRMRAFKPWYATDVIRFASLDEFLQALDEMDVRIMDSLHVLFLGRVSRKRPPLANLLVKDAVFLLGRR